MVLKLMLLLLELLLMLLLLIFPLLTLLMKLTSLLLKSMLMILVLRPLPLFLILCSLLCYHVIVFDAAFVIVVDGIADIVLDIKVIVIITFVVVNFTANIIDIHLIVVADDVSNVIVVIVVVVNVAVIAIAPLVNEIILDTGMVICICSTIFFCFHCCQRLLLFLFLDISIYSFEYF